MAQWTPMRIRHPDLWHVLGGLVVFVGSALALLYCLGIIQFGQ